LGITERIIFPGIRPHSEIPLIIGASSVLINLISGYTDLRSMKILEYMSSGGVVISNRDRIFGFNLSHGENFYHIDDTTPEKLSEAIIRLLDDEPLRRRIGAGARKLILDNFSWEKTVRKLLEVIDEVAR
jgi:glycosyltransferase involved in cell wall biosynthesis